MQQILIACGDVDLLRRIVSDLPEGQFKPIATKSGSGIAAKLASRDVRVAIVHEALSDGPGAGLCSELQGLQNPPAILYLSSSKPPDSGPFDLALRYPVPGPVLRNGIRRVVGSGAGDHDLQRWKAFYEELQARLEAAAEQNYYEMLGVRPDAPHHAIVTNYDRLSVRYHPDRYNQLRGERWGAAIYDHANELYKLLTESFSVLNDRRLKKKYDKALRDGRIRLSHSEKNAADAGPELLESHASSAQGKKFLRLAQRDMARNDWAAALQNLKFAASMEPDLAIIAEKIAEVEAKMDS
jgi:hypothetical protein